jgi:hypothetical protein
VSSSCQQCGQSGRTAIEASESRRTPGGSRYHDGGRGARGAADDTGHLLAVDWHKRHAGKVAGGGAVLGACHSGRGGLGGRVDDIVVDVVREAHKVGTGANHCRHRTLWSSEDESGGSERLTNRVPATRPLCTTVVFSGHSRPP